MDLNLSYTFQNSLQGMEAFAKGLPDSDFAGAGLSLRDEYKEQLADRRVTPVHVPVAAGALVLAYNIWMDFDGDGKVEQLNNLQLSPRTVADIFQGEVDLWDDQRIAADNPTLKLENKRVEAVGRADRSAATFWLSSWLTAKAHDAWASKGGEYAKGAITIFPAPDRTQLRTGTSAVADLIRNWFRSSDPVYSSDDRGDQDTPFFGFIGFVYLSEALKLGLPMAALQNASGAFVKPTTESITAGFNAGTLSSDGIFTPNFDATDPAAYPLPVLSYVIAPTRTSKGVDATKAQTLGRVLDYAIGTGQDAAPLRGYIPLTAPMKAAAAKGITAITPRPPRRRHRVHPRRLRQRPRSLPPRQECARFDQLGGDRRRLRVRHLRRRLHRRQRAEADSPAFANTASEQPSNSVGRRSGPPQ